MAVGLLPLVLPLFLASTLRQECDLASFLFTLPFPPLFLPPPAGPPIPTGQIKQDLLRRGSRWAECGTGLRVSLLEPPFPHL